MIKISPKICSELLNHVSNTLHYNNISSQKRLFKLNSWSIDFAQLSNICDAKLCNNGWQLKAVKHCCTDLYHICSLDFLMSLCIFKILNKNRFFYSQETFPQLGDFSTIRGLFSNHGSFPWVQEYSESKDFFTKKDISLIKQRF